jgi:hypothetical protein
MCPALDGHLSPAPYASPTTLAATAREEKEAGKRACSTRNPAAQNRDRQYRHRARYKRSVP